VDLGSQLRQLAFDPCVSVYGVTGIDVGNGRMEGLGRCVGVDGESHGARSKRSVGDHLDTS